MSIFSSVFSEKHSSRKSISVSLYIGVDAYLPAYVHACLYIYNLSVQAKLMTHWISLAYFRHQPSIISICKLPYLPSSSIWFNHVQSLSFAWKTMSCKVWALSWMYPMYPHVGNLGVLLAENCQMADRGWSSWCTMYRVYCLWKRALVLTNKEQRVTLNDWSGAQLLIDFSS